jgi:hypothetical protein
MKKLNQDFTLTIQAVRSSQILVSFRKTTRCQNPEDLDLNLYRGENTTLPKLRTHNIRITEKSTLKDASDTHKDWKQHK